MGPSLFTFFGWAALTYYWLHANATFFRAIAQAIEYHNDTMKAHGYARAIIEEEEEKA